MSQFVLFNGSVLVRPGASTKIDASQFQNVALSGLGIVGLIGEADGGAPRSVQIFTSPAAVKTFYKSGDLVEAAAIAASPGNDPRIATGAQSIVCYKVNNSTQSTLVHDGKLTFLTRQYGVSTLTATIALAAGTGSARIATITDLDDFGALKTEVSPELGGTGKFTIQYVGAGTPAVMTITATTLTTTITGAAADNLSLTFADYPTLSALLARINATGKYVATALVTNAVSFDTTNLDAVAGVNILVLATVYARNFDIADWINTNSSILSVTLTKGQVSPVAVLVATPLAGGTRGTSANSDWITGFTALRSVRINQLVPLVSADAITAQGTFTAASILASLVAHCKFVSSTAGRNECQGWFGMTGTRAALIAAANLQNSEHICLYGQKVQLQRTSDGTLTTFAEWATALAVAGMRAGAPLGEPITWKYIQAFAVTSDASWSESNNDDCTALALNGVSVINNIQGKGFRVDKGITTFTKQNNDAYTEETIVQIWKAVSYELRSTLEDVYVGRPGTVLTVQTVPAVVSRVLELFRQSGAITDSVINGVTIRAYRDITVQLSGDKLYVSVTISPTPGINFVLNTITLVPAQISV